MRSFPGYTARRSIILLSCTIVLPVLALAAFSFFAMRSQRQSMERERRVDLMADGILDQINLTFQQMESGVEDVSRALLNQDLAGPLLAQVRRQTAGEAVWIATRSMDRFRPFPIKMMP